MLAALASPVVRYALLALALMGALSYMTTQAANTAREAAVAQCKADNADALTAERERQKLANQETLAAARERAILAEREAQELREKADAIIKDLAGTNRSCRLDDDTLQRLRGIR